MFQAESFATASFAAESWAGLLSPAPADDGPHGPPAPPRRDPTMSQTMAACLLWVGAQQSGLARAGRSDATT